MNAEQEKRALDLLSFFADGCDCGPQTTCYPCRARDLLSELGWKLDDRGVYRPSKETS